MLGTLVQFVFEFGKKSYKIFPALDPEPSAGPVMVGENNLYGGKLSMKDVEAKPADTTTKPDGLPAN